MRSTLLRNRYILFLDILLCFLSYIALFVIGASLSLFDVYFKMAYPIIVLTALDYVIVFYFFGMYRTAWDNSGSFDYILLVLSCFVSAVISIILGIIFPGEHIYAKWNIAANIIYSGVICASRSIFRVFSKYVSVFNTKGKKRVLIYGAGSLAVTLLRDIALNPNLKYSVVGLIDDDESKMNMRIYNTTVIGTRKNLNKICQSRNIEEIIFAIHTIPLAEKNKILDICADTGVKVKILPGIESSLMSDSFKQIREISIEDLLERDTITLDNSLIENDIHDKTILVTGGGGSIGSELCRQIIKFKPAKLIILDIYENTTYELENEIRDNYPEQNIEVLIASVRDKKRLDAIFAKYRPDMVFHAAAHKHVPLMETSPQEAIKNNVFGTFNTASCANKYGAKRFILISTDKAVNPTNVMGATKRMCEMIVQTMQQISKTEYVAVRFGNVLGSHGSVIPRFKHQIESGGPVTVTHPEITRFFMTIPEAAQLVLQAAAYARGGEIFILDMGEPCKIYDLAKKLIKLYGYKPEIDIKIEFIGLRPGEKLYEELLMNEEGLKQTSHKRIFIGKPIEISKDVLDEKLNKLENVIDKDEEEVKRVIADVIPTYQYRSPEKNSAENNSEKEAVLV